MLGRCGDPSLRVFLRSAAKPFQVLPLIEAGGVERLRLASRDVALICASHGGEPRHVRGVEHLLECGGFRTNDLVCGPHLPAHDPSARKLLSRGKSPTRLHDNCSGKHAGLLLACRLLGFPAKGYWQASHPLQLVIRRRLSELASFPESEIDSAVDGCGLAVFRLPLATILSAMWERPDMVAGTGFFTTAYLRAGRNRWIGKEGAEAVYAVGLRASAASGRAAGIALKIEDGGARARPAVTLALRRAMHWLPASARRSLAEFASPPVENAAGAVVGSIEADVPIIRRDGAS